MMDILLKGEDNVQLIHLAQIPGSETATNFRGVTLLAPIINISHCL